MSTYANKELFDYMTNLSVRHFDNDWESGLEYTLWHWIHHTSPLSLADKHQLYILHTRANGWYAFLDEPSEGQVFLTTNKWIRLFMDEFDGAVN